MMSFSWTDYPLDEQLIKSLIHNGFDTPLPIQVKSLEATTVQDKHVLGAAQTGSGKTLAYTIPVVNKILKCRNKPCSLLKYKICRVNRRKEDFDLIDGQMVSVEDMIVDKDLTEESDEEQESQDCDETSSESSPRPSSTCPEAIILVPTRELAIQVKDEVDRICKDCDIHTCCLIGGLSQDKQVRMLNKNKPEIIIATPGRLYDMVESNEIEHINIHSIASIRTLVIDEADRMMQKGHFEEMIKLIAIIKESAEFRGDDFSFRVYLYSATLTFIHELPERLRPQGQNKKSQLQAGPSGKRRQKSENPIEQTKKSKISQMLSVLGVSKQDTEIIDLNNEISHGRPSAQQLSEFKINCLISEKDLYLYYFLVLNNKKRVLVFCNSKDCLRRLVNVIKHLGINSLQLHADMDQKQRLKSLEKFRVNKSSVLIATDVAARGLDIKSLDCVVHYQVPKTCESYIHRSGRTARLNESGISLTLCEPKEIQYYKKICNQINCGKDIQDFDVDIRLKHLLADRVHLAQQCDKIDHHLRDKKSTENWFTKAAKDADIELDDMDLDAHSGKGRHREEHQQVDAKNRGRLNALKKQLNSLLRKPLVHQGKRLVNQSC